MHARALQNVVTRPNESEHERKLSLEVMAALVKGGAPTGIPPLNERYARYL